jgi:DNA polymerase-1
MTETTLLIDADILAYKWSAAGQQVFNWPDGTVTITHDDPEEVAGRMDTEVASQVELLKATKVIICLTDKINFRHSVLPSYKGNRKDLAKPVLLADMKQYLADNYETYKRPGLEADDVMGILATHPGLWELGKRIIVSIDKDMRQIPGWLFNPDKDHKAKLITKEEGDKWHMVQTLAGDPTDGYTGCPGAGYGIADEMLTESLRFTPYQHEFTRGKRKGETETRWSVEPAAGPWETVVSIYAKHGLTEEDALVQARVAKICQYENYNLHSQEVILWTPNRK